MKEKLTFAADPGQLAEVRRSVSSFLDQCGFDECTTQLLVLAVDEACTNIIRYAYDHEAKPIRLEMDRKGDLVRLILRDYGKACDPKRIRGRPLEDVRPGGVGVHIIRTAFDKVKYEPCAQGTRLILEKKLAGPGQPS